MFGEREIKKLRSYVAAARLNQPLTDEELDETLRILRGLSADESVEEGGYSRSIVIQRRSRIYRKFGTRNAVSVVSKVLAAAVAR